MGRLKTFFKDVAVISAHTIYQVMLSLAIVGFLLMLTLSLWMPRVEKEILGMCKDYHATQSALESQKAWTLPSGQSIPPLIPMETPFK